ncbi:unnamed protein product, partial [Iphiclides podalirius]
MGMSQRHGHMHRHGHRKGPCGMEGGACGPSGSGGPPIDPIGPTGNANCAPASDGNMHTISWQSATA